MEAFGFKIEVKRTGRKKSASISISGNLVKITVPKSLSDDSVRDLIHLRASWIKRKFKEQSLRPISKAKEHVSGEIYLYLGSEYHLKVLNGEEESIKMVGGYLVATIPDFETNRSERVKFLLEGWYQRQADRLLKDKTDRLAKIVGVCPRSVSIKSYKSRWGSCSSNGELTYNWRIILAPHRIVDYVVLHELCHLLEHNHSARYWAHVERHAPGWRACRDWLRHNQQVLGMGNDRI